MTKWRVKFMVDPGDGIVETKEFYSTNDITGAIEHVYENYGEYFIISMEIIWPVGQVSFAG